MGSNQVSEKNQLQNELSMIPKIHPLFSTKNAPGFLRRSIAIGFLSAVASRLGLWGQYSSGWTNFTKYMGDLLYFIPSVLIAPLAIIVTFLETFIGITILLGLFNQLSAIMGGFLTLLFAVAMTIANGVKDPLDYSVFVFSAACFTLAYLDKTATTINKNNNH